jgi:hypothetical protein
MTQKCLGLGYCVTKKLPLYSETTFGMQVPGLKDAARANAKPKDLRVFMPTTVVHFKIRIRRRNLPKRNEQYSPQTKPER